MLYLASGSPRRRAFWCADSAAPLSPRNQGALHALPRIRLAPAPRFLVR